MEFNSIQIVPNKFIKILFALQVITKKNNEKQLQ